MLTHFKINSELDPMEWIEDENDFSMFVMVIAAVRHKLGMSTCVVSNKKHQADVSKRFRAIGCHTIKCVSQFDVMIETSIASLSRENQVIGLKGLSAYLNAKRAVPFHLAGLKAIEDYNINILGCAVVQEQEDEGLGHASPLTP